MRRFASLALALLLAFPAHAQFIRLAATSGNPASSRSAWVSAVSAMYAGTAKNPVILAGPADSLTWGQGTGQPPIWPSSSGFGAADAFSHSYPTAVAELLAASLGVPVVTGSIGFGNMTTAAAVTSYRPSITFSGGANWVPASTGSNYYTLGGAVLQNASDTTSVVSETPVDIYGTAVAWDSVDIYYLTGATFGVISADLAGGGYSNLTNAGGTDAFSKVTLTKALATGALNFKRVSGTAAIVGWRTYNSTIKQVTILNAGWPGANSTQLVNTAKTWGPLAAIDVIAAPMGLVYLGANDRGLAGSGSEQVTTSTYTANLATIGNRIKNAGTGSNSVLLINPESTAAASSGTPGTSGAGLYYQTQAIQDTYSAANGNALASIGTASQVDMYTAMGTWATIQANGYEFKWDGGGVHITSPGAAVVAAAVKTALMSGVSAPGSSYAVDYLLAGGGGGGAAQVGGGGGGGGVTYNASAPLYAGTTYTITVGAAGAGGSGGLDNATNGGMTTLVGGNVTLAALGGGAGGNSQYSPGHAGGSGGGGGGGGNSGVPMGGIARGRQGFTGGAGPQFPNWGAGGGGGSAVGTTGNSTRAGDGGAGLSSSIIGSAQVYGSGGGGGGGNGGSAAAGFGGTNAGAGSASGAGAAATANFGGGGGGGSYSGGSFNGGAGGSGVVILSIVTGAFTPTTTGSPTVTTSGGRTIYKYTGPGTFVVP